MVRSQVSTTKKINSLNKRIKGLTKKYPLQLGSVLRVACQALENWGIKVTEKNREWIEEEVRNDYKKDWERADKATYDAIHRAVKDSGLGPGNEQLNVNLAEVAVDILLGIAKLKTKHERISLCDIGAGEGATTGAILREVKIREPKILKKLDLYFLEPSKGITKIYDLMEAYPEVENPQYMRATDYSHLPRIMPGSFDLVVSNAVLHHNTFPTYIDQIHRVLKDEGVCIVGDWYAEVWYHPEYVAYIMKEGLKVGKKGLRGFLEHMGINNFEEVREFWNACPDDVKQRNEGMLRYVKHIGIEMKKLQTSENADLDAEVSEDSTELEIPSAEDIVAGRKKISKLSLLEGHEKHDDRKKKFAEGGFETDPKKVKQCPACKNLEEAEIETVPPMFAVVNAFAKKSTGLTPSIRTTPPRGVRTSSITPRRSRRSVPPESRKPPTRIRH